MFFAVYGSAVFEPVSVLLKPEDMVRVLFRCRICLTGDCRAAVSMQLANNLALRGLCVVRSMNEKEGIGRRAYIVRLVDAAGCCVDL